VTVGRWGGGGPGCPSSSVTPVVLTNACLGQDYLVQGIWWDLVCQFNKAASENPVFRRWKVKKPKAKRFRLRVPNKRTMAQAALTKMMNQDRPRGVCVSSWHWFGVFLQHPRVPSFLENEFCSTSVCLRRCGPAVLSGETTWMCISARLSCVGQGSGESRRMRWARDSKKKRWPPKRPPL